MNKKPNFLFFIYGTHLLKGNLLSFFIHQNSEQLWQNPNLIGSRGISSPIVIFKNKKEKELFIEYLDKNIDTIKKQEFDGFIKTIEPTQIITEQDISTLKLCLKIKSIHTQWLQKKI